MATNKKSVLLYCDIIHTIEPLTNEEAGRLFKHYLRYINDQNPEPEDRLTALLFEPIKQNLKRDLKKWEQERLKRSESGKLGMKSRWGNKDNTIITNDNTVIKPITNITDTVTVNVTVKDNVSVIEKWFLEFPNSSQLELIGMNLNITKENLTSRIPDFRKVAKVDYPNFNEFCNHFKNWVKKNPQTQTFKTKELK